MFAIHILSCCLSTLGSPEADLPPAPELVETSSSVDGDAQTRGYAEALATLLDLNERINLGEPVQAQLLEALTQLIQFTPELAEDAQALRDRSLAQLNLARSHLNEGKTDDAARVMDEVIRSSFGEELPLTRLGPSIGALHASRLEDFEAGGTASIAVSCELDCQVYINERRVDERTDGLYLGIYRVWVEAKGPHSRGEQLVQVVELREPGDVVELTLERDVPPPSPPPPPPPPPERLVGRSAEIALLVVGMGATAAGSLLMGVNPDQSKAQLGLGVALTVVGSGALVGGSVTLAIDEVRIGRHEGRQAVLGWGMRF